MLANEVCAIIVTFRPAANVVANLIRVRPQVKAMVVVDNGSPAETLSPIAKASSELDFVLIANAMNLGIAAALNLGAREAKAQGYEFVALFDQDSTITEGCVAAMVGEYRRHPAHEKIAVVTPLHLERETGEWLRPAFAEDGSPLTAITSGSLMPTAVFEHCGWFEEDLIIDRVDDEYCLRARAMGYSVALCREAILFHSIGAPETHSFLGLRQVKSTHHSAARQYYLARNRIVMVRRYWRRHSRWCFLTARSVVRDLIVNFVVEEDRWRKACMTLRGVFDGLAGKMGMVVPL